MMTLFSWIGIVFSVAAASLTVAGLLILGVAALADALAVSGAFWSYLYHEEKHGRLRLFGFRLPWHRRARA